MVAAADHRLSDVRAAGMADAGAMLLAADQEHARACAQVVEAVTGHRPTLALSDDPAASAQLDRFAASRDRWLVAVRLVSEGVDIPRLAVGCWATPYRTPLFFAQAVGRFLRARRPGETATVFLPAVRPLLALAAEWEADRDHVLAAPPPTVDPLPAPPAVDPPTPRGSPFEALDAQAAFAHVLAAGRAVTGEDPIEVSEEDREFLGLPGLLDPAQTAAVLRGREADLRRVAARRRPPAGGDTDPPVHEQTTAVRREINTLVAALAARTGAPHAHLHARVRRVVPGPPSAAAPLTVLIARRDHLRGLLAADRRCG